MNHHSISIGLDVHARSISACAFDPLTGEVQRKRFGYEAGPLADWILSFDNPKAVYESGVTGFDLCRSLRALGVDCVVGAVSKMQRPAANKLKKNDMNDAEFLARLLSTNNISEVLIPDEECEAARDLARIHDDVRKNLNSARQRLNNFLMRKGYIFNEKTPTGAQKVRWGHDHWAWINKIHFDQEVDNDVLDFYISEVHHLEEQKQHLEKLITQEATRPRWKDRIDSLRCLKGIEIIVAFALVVEADVFARFKNASAFAAWLGLTPSEHSSGESESKGGITKAGNTLCRRLLIEASWTYTRASRARKRPPTEDVPKEVQDQAAKATVRLVKRHRHLIAKGKRSVVANAAVARELAGFIWSIGCMAEGVCL